MLGVLVSGEIWFKVPETIRINWNGVLNKGVMAKDVILRTIGVVGHAGPPISLWSSEEAP